MTSPLADPAGRLGFVVGGAQKCGTTALHAYLCRHPELEMAREKETHFFDEEAAVDWRAPDYGPLHAQFTGGTERLRGEATPITLYWTPAYWRLLRYNPDIRFVFMLRDPVERAWSHWRMNIRRELDHLPFDRAIREGRMRVLADPLHSGLARHSSYIERGWYGRQVAALTTLFPIANMLFLRQQDLADDPDAVLGRVADFLKLSPFAPVEPVRANVAEPDDHAPMSEADRAYLTDIFHPDLVRLHALTGVALGSAEDAPVR